MGLCTERGKEQSYSQDVVRLGLDLRQSGVRTSVLKISTKNLKIMWFFSPFSIPLLFPLLSPSSIRYLLLPLQAVILLWQVLCPVTLQQGPGPSFPPSSSFPSPSSLSLFLSVFAFFCLLRWGRWGAKLLQQKTCFLTLCMWYICRM